MFNALCNVGCAMNLAENIFLLMLTSISSVENHGGCLLLISFQRSTKRVSWASA